MLYLEDLIFPDADLKSWAQLTSEGVCAVRRGLEHQHKGTTGAETVGVAPAGVPQYYCDQTQVHSRELRHMTKEDLRRDRSEDPICNLIKRVLVTKRPPDAAPLGTPE